MKNKRVKQMMADVFNGHWYRHPKDGSLCLMVHEGYIGDARVSVNLHKFVSLTANQLKGIK